jgi:hypothetical protein
MKRHPLDLFSLLGGLLFMGLGLAFLLDALNKWSTDITWVPPVVLIVLGLAGVLSTFGRRQAAATAVAAPGDAQDPNSSRNSAGATASSCE